MSISIRGGVVLTGRCRDIEIDIDTLRADIGVAYRNGQRWVQTYERVVPGNTAHRSPFRQGGVYLITGGLGKIGVAISADLAERYRARLVLVGRSRLPGRESWDAWIGSHPADDPVSTSIG